MRTSRRFPVVLFPSFFNNIRFSQFNSNKIRYENWLTSYNLLHLIKTSRIKIIKCGKFSYNRILVARGYHLHCADAWTAEHPKLSTLSVSTYDRSSRRWQQHTHISHTETSSQHSQRRKTIHRPSPRPALTVVIALSVCCPSIPAQYIYSVVHPSCGRTANEIASGILCASENNEVARRHEYVPTFYSG